MGIGNWPQNIALYISFILGMYIYIHVLHIYVIYYTIVRLLYSRIIITFYPNSNVIIFDDDVEMCEHCICFVLFSVSIQKLADYVSISMSQSICIYEVFFVLPVLNNHRIPFLSTLLRNCQNRVRTSAAPIHRLWLHHLM